MTKSERKDLQDAAKLRAKVARSHVAQLKAERLADFEEQLATEYDVHDQRWAEAVAEGQREAKAAEAKINARINEQLADVPERFRPSFEIHMGWMRRGENYFAERRAELRKVATTRLDELAKKALATIDERLSEIQLHLLSGGLETDAAKQYLESIPSVSDLMPELTPAEVEPERRRALMQQATTAPSRHERAEARRALAAEDGVADEDDDF